MQGGLGGPETENGGAGGRRAPPSFVRPGREEVAGRRFVPAKVGGEAGAELKCGGSREEVGTAAGPMTLREEEEGLSHAVGA